MLLALSYHQDIAVCQVSVSQKISLGRAILISSARRKLPNIVANLSRILHYCYVCGDVCYLDIKSLAWISARCERHSLLDAESNVYMGSPYSLRRAKISCGQAVTVSRLACIGLYQFCTRISYLNSHRYHKLKRNRPLLTEYMWPTS